MSSKGLAYWARGADAPATFFPTVIELMQQPGFAEVARQCAERTAVRPDREALGRASSHDIYRLYYLLVVLYLDASGGITRTRLIDVCREMRIASPGRAVALLNQLRRIGYVALDENQPDRRTRLYRPTQAMVEDFRREQLAELQSLAALEPEVALAMARFDDPQVFRAFLLRLGTGTAEYVKHRYETDIALFTDRNAGFATLLTMIATADRSDPFPPKGPLQASMAGLSKRLHVSRGHIFRLLRDAETRGLLRRDVAKGHVWLDETLRFLVAAYLGAMFLGFLTSCHAALNATARR